MTKKCVLAQGFSLGGMTLQGGHWWHGQIVIAGRVEIVVSACLKRGAYVRRWELNKYFLEGIFLISSRSHLMSGLMISQVPREFGEVHGEVFTTRSSVERRISRI